jgi:hypothetical protein
MNNNLLAVLQPIWSSLGCVTHENLAWSVLSDWRDGIGGLQTFEMEVPLLDGFVIGKLIGYGGCGKVYRAHNPAGVECAVKVFDGNSVSCALLGKMTRRLETGGWPEGVMPVMAADFEPGHSFWTTPLLLTAEAERIPVPQSLQMMLDQYPGEHSWKVVRSMARALAGMHSHRVAHGNLKPGNLFVNAEREVLLSDWAMGNMPGVKELHFTDAVLYQSPEQLRNPAGYLNEAGYRWDVFSFGVLSYRILTGKFPRCHETFGFVAPAAGETRKEGLQADLGKIAKNLEVESDVAWADAPHDALEEDFRAWIDRCLLLDPMRRPATMMEVVAGFEAAEIKSEVSHEREMMLDQRRRAERRAWRALFLAGASLTAAVTLGALWQLSNIQAEIGRGQQGVELQILNSSLNVAKHDKSEAERQQKEAEKLLAKAEQAVIYEREVSMARLESSRLIGDRLFGWAMEKGNRRLPPLDGRELRLKQLEQYFTEFLKRSEDTPALADERARVRLQLAEISLAAGDAPIAGQRLSEAIDAWADLPMNAELKFRMATNSLLLALLLQEKADPDADSAFVTARRNLMNVPQAEVDSDRLNQLLAILDFQEAKALAAKGEDAQALEQLMRATQTLNRIADQRPDAAILRSELAACYLSSSTILEGMGKLGDAREVRALASVELVRLLEKTPDDFALRLELAGCYAAMAEAAMLAGDVSGAESISKEAMKLLDRLVVEQPDNADAVARKASQLGLRAGIQRDRGLGAEALKDYEEGIRMLEAIRVSAPDNATVSYRLALLLWQKGRMLGMSGKRDEEIKLIARAGDMLSQLETGTSGSGPRPEQLQSSGAYLLGDLGHALQLGNQKEKARQAFADAVTLWESLLKSRPQSEEFSEGLNWCRQRLDDLK